MPRKFSYFKKGDQVVSAYFYRGSGTGKRVLRRGVIVDVLSGFYEIRFDGDEHRVRVTKELGERLIKKYVVKKESRKKFKFL